MNPTAIIQARLGSTRLPGKVLRPIQGQPMLWHIVRRVRHTPGLAQVVVATSDQAGDAPIRAFCAEAGIPCFAGSEQDVLDRFYQAAVEYGGDPVIRITGDCPLVDPQVIGRVLALYGTGDYDHVGVATGAGALFLDGGRFPDGLDAECFSHAALEHAWREASRPSDREHVTPYLWRQPDQFRLGVLKSPADYSRLRWTVDNAIDFQLISRLYEALDRADTIFHMDDILAYLQAHPELTSLNQDLIGQEGYQALWTDSPTHPMAVTP